MDKNEQNKRKQILRELREKEREDFEQSLPMSRELFEQLFDFLDKELEEQICDNINKIAYKFLIDNNLDNEIIIN